MYIRKDNYDTHFLDQDTPLSEFREFIREELPDPKPPRKWFTNQMAKLRRANPEMSPLERSRKVKEMWYNLPSHEQKMLSKEPTLVEKRK